MRSTTCGRSSESFATARRQIDPSSHSRRWMGLEALVEDATHAGVSITTDVAVDSASVPERIARTAYRVIQEALTNVKLDTLSPRERDVADAVARGLSNADIAAEMHYSVATVKAYVSRIFDRLGVDNRVQVAILVHDAAPTQSR